MDNKRELMAVHSCERIDPAAETLPNGIIVILHLLRAIDGIEINFLNPSQWQQRQNRIYKIGREPYP